MAEHRVIVVGAGIGGLVSALLLAARGLDVTLLEAADGRYTPYRVFATPWPAVAPAGERFMAKETWRLVTRGPDGELVIHDFDSPEPLLRSHLQIGTDDCSTDLELRGAPVFRSLIGPMPEGTTIVRYETPEVFEALTKEWAMPRPPRRRSRAKKTAEQ